MLSNREGLRGGGVGAINISRTFEGRIWGRGFHLNLKEKRSLRVIIFSLKRFPVFFGWKPTSLKSQTAILNFNRVFSRQRLFYTASFFFVLSHYVVSIFPMVKERWKVHKNFMEASYGRLVSRRGWINFIICKLLLLLHQMKTSDQFIFLKEIWHDELSM